MGKSRHPEDNPVIFIPPKYIGAWGEEVYFSCTYMGDSGEREYDGEIIYDDALVQVDYQTSGTFEARPDWAKGLYCSGKTNVREEGYLETFGSSHVIKTTSTTGDGYGREYASSEMKAVADDIISQIEQAPYAISCP